MHTAHSLQLDPIHRKFIPADFKLSNWESIQPYFQELLDREINTRAELEKWLQDFSELSAVTTEEQAWRFIRMACNTRDEALRKHFNDFLEHIAPELETWNDKLLRKYHSLPQRQELDAEDFRIFNLTVEKELELYREENVRLKSELQTRAQEFGAKVGEMTVMVEGQEYTLQQAGRFLERHDRTLRREVYQKVTQRRLRDRDWFDELLDELIEKRTRLARIAGYESYTDYKFRDLGRFDYGRAECQAFHTAVEEVVKPIYNDILAARQQRLAVDRLRPWDLAVDPMGQQPLQPFADGKELVAKTVRTLSKLRPELGAMIAKMDEMQHLDLDSRIGKAPGGFNYPLPEIGVPFIFMNAVGLQSDLTTMVHEAGHAIHSFLTRQMRYNFWKDVPSEIAELASMSMELISMDHWDEFYDDPAQLRRARTVQMERSIGALPWIATIDAFQTWLYDHPDHSCEARRQQWVQLYNRFHGERIDYTGFEDTKANLWQKQLHLFEVPFYYIEYGFAQLGAFQVWRNYKADPEAGLQAYLEGLKMGYTRPIDITYQTAGARFAFDTDFMRELFAFVQAEYQQLTAAG